ncbi:GTPase-activating protein [Linnemannia gamsii]|uniref:GTPase-activating protein n=1 Tax=Linnemannia gamsii TaxID=64522 RepID=A0A9P6UFJ1_9FUNG|nr:GTPase-activating protein [Linnemannia gamsii]
MLANKYNTDSYGSSDTQHAPDHVAPVAHASPPTTAPVIVEVTTTKHPEGDVAPEQKDSRNSWEENDSDDEPYPMDAYDYGRDDDDDDDDSESESDSEQQDKNNNNSNSNSHSKPNGAMTFDQPSDDDLADATPNPNLFRTSAVNPRASINSGRSYSSHTKHHSFGYGDDRPEASESESDSSSESESEQEEAFANASSSPPPPPIPSASRPVSITASLRVLSTTTESPVTSQPAVKDEQQQQKVTQVATTEVPPPVNEGIRASSPTASPTLSKSTASIISTAAPTNPQTLTSPTSTSSFAPSDQTHRPSGSESDTSTSSVERRSPSSLKGNHLKAANQRPGMLPRSVSSTSSRGPQDSRPLSYSDLSDAELNDVSLDEPATQEPIRRSATIATPRAPVVPSNAGFPSSFFGGRPHPKSHQFQQQQSSSGLSSPQAAAPPPVPLPSSATSPENRPGSIRQGSISSIASSISGAFMGRGFGSNNSNSNTAALPPPPSTPRTPSRMSQRGSNAGMVINTGTADLDLRKTNNISPERASTYSTMTTDSNMDLLLARLDAQNSALEKDPKSESTSEIDRAFGHAKEESSSEDVDWDYWGSLMHDYNGVVKKNPKQLTVMIQMGVPPAIRGLTWQLLAQSKDAQLEVTYADLLKETSSHEKQIQRDMSRTFPNHEYFQAEGLGQESLFNVVKAYSLYDAEVGYCQGLSFVVGPLLLNMPDEEAFCLLVKMMSSYDMRGHFTPDMNTLQLRLYQFEQLMEETVPMVHKHFLNQGIRSTMYASQWFMTLFAYKFPLDLVFRIYDTLLVEGVESLLRFAIALLKANHDQILNHDFETLIEFLKNGLFEPYKNDASMFVKDAYNVKVTPKKLAQYAQKYQAMIQRQQAELAAEESLRESNRQLSMHVRRLEGSLHTLNKEHVDLAKELISRKVEMAQLQDQNDVLIQKVSDLTRMVDAQGKEVEDRYKDEIQAVLEKNVALVKKNEQADEQCSFLESLLIDTKMKYAESENERDTLARKLNDLKKALGVA